MGDEASIREKSEREICKEVEIEDARWSDGAGKKDINSSPKGLSKMFPTRPRLM